MRDFLPGASHKKWDRAPRIPVPIVAAAIGVAATSAAAIVAAAVINTIIGFVVTTLLNFVLGKLFAPKPKQSELKRELRREVSLPLKRYVYGHAEAPGTPAPWKVKGKFLYGCLVLNSRPSDGGNITIRLDKRDVTLGSPANLTNFASSGATATNAPFTGFCRFWLGLGAQTAPPADILSEAGTIFNATDSWEGLTVLWVALDAGPAASRADRWPSVPPDVDVEMDYSKVWDPRDGAQSLANPATWTFSANQALAALDCHTQNPIQPYTETDLDLDMWKAAADAADEAVALDAGGTEPRYEVHGVVGFDGAELEDFLRPLFEAGASEPVMVGGRTGIAAGVYQAPTLTVTDVIGDELEIETLRPGRDVSNTVRTTYTSSERAWEAAELPPYSVAGAVAADGGIPTEQRLDLGLVTSPTQAGRVRKIAAHRLRAQKRISCELPPDAVDLVAGAGVTVTFPAPFDAANGVYQVEEITPTLIDLDEDGGGGVAMRLPAVLREYSADWFAWDETTEEPAVAAFVPVTTDVPTLAAPSSLSLTTKTVGSGDATLLMGLLAWDPAPTEAVSLYEVQYQPASAGEWIAGATVYPNTLNGAGKVEAEVGPLNPALTYDFRVRSLAGGRFSAWDAIGGQSVSAPAPSVTPPINGAATAVGTSAIDVAYTLPNEQTVAGIDFYAGNSSDTGTMSLLGSRIFAGPNTRVEVTESGLSPSTTRFYATKTVDDFGQTSGFSAVVSATTDP